jgi:RNA polymerase sigma factor (sigma-70 family)
MKKISYYTGSNYADLAAYTRFMAEDNSAQLSRLKRNLSHAMRQDITERQRQYMMLYYGQNMSMETIAKELGVNKSTVSRTLKRGRQRLYRCLRYGAAALLEEAEAAERR